MSTFDITLNGKKMLLPTGATLADTIETSGIQPPFAAAVNLQFVTRDKYSQTPLKAGDQVELIAPVTGG